MSHNADFCDLKCLVVDGNKHERALLKTALEALNMSKLIMAAEAESGLEILRTRQVDLIIVDMELAEISGIDFTRIVRRGNLVPRSEVPIIMVAESREARTVMLAVEAGMSAFVGKPFSVSILKEKIFQTAFNSRPTTRGTEIATRTGHAVNQ